MSKYFKETTIAKSHKLHGVVERHCAALAFAGEMKVSGADQFQESFGDFLRTIGELPNTDFIGEQFGESGVYYNTRVISTGSSLVPDSGEKGEVILETGEDADKELEEKQS